MELKKTTVKQEDCAFIGSLTTRDNFSVHGIHLLPQTNAVRQLVYHKVILLWREIVFLLDLLSLVPMPGYYCFSTYRLYSFIKKTPRLTYKGIN